MIVGKDVTLNIRFPVGRKYVIATIAFKQGEDSEEILRIFLLKENIPIYLENSIFATVHSFLQDDSFIKEEVDLLVNCDVMENNMKELSNALSKTTRYYYRDISPVLTIANVKQSLSKFDENSMKFEREFHGLVRQNVQTCELIIRANESLQTAYQKLTSLRKVELDDLYSNQSDEMNKAMGLDQSNISNLVVKHVKELEELESKYREKIDALKKMQRIKYREYISKIFHGEKIEYSQFDPMDEDDSRVEKKWNRRWFKLRDEPLESQPEIKVEEEKLGYECTIVVSLGNKTPILYSIQINSSPIPSLIRRSMKDKRLQVKALKSIYGKSLSGYVLISEPNLSYQSKTTTDLIDINEMSTELHFTSLTEQLNDYKSQIDPPVDMKLGDVFITKHSNLGDANVLFHLFGINTKKSPITENSLQCNFDSPLFTGLKNIFEVSLQYDISTITIPLLLMDSLPEHLFNHPACLGRSITVMRAVKSLLLDSTDDSLKTIRFILPPVSQDVFEKYKSALKNVFTYQL